MLSYEARVGSILVMNYITANSLLQGSLCVDASIALTAPVVSAYNRSVVGKMVQICVTWFLCMSRVLQCMSTD